MSDDHTYSCSVICKEDPSDWRGDAGQEALGIMGWPDWRGGLCGLGWTYPGLAGWPRWRTGLTFSNIQRDDIRFVEYEDDNYTPLSDHAADCILQNWAMRWLASRGYSTILSAGGGYIVEGLRYCGSDCDDVLIAAILQVGK